jgi:Icc protein
MLIAQISDMHLSTPESRNDEIYHTADHLARAVAHLNALEPRPDVVLATGDLVERGEAGEYERLYQQLEPLRMPVYLVPGNHDDRVILPHVLDRHRYLPRDGGFIQYTVEDWPVRLVALDTRAPAPVDRAALRRHCRMYQSRHRAPARPRPGVRTTPRHGDGAAGLSPAFLDGQRGPREPPERDRRPPRPVHRLRRA